ncbi:hypothetical protein PB2503_10224 [Parvularcula bermudensis HTCC2503]|uniref:Uncharacterized protein n=1 Tax=Parvularcula bermudensis (strain ATCC BAA-594 / HTCC2503 / KCTC 12087) TaxID=314260 RepID=E0TFH2_PARBH|nr:hypothetical protein [Parvularcula bermudensis]ADM10096.1 hypothetical protein PB2503_10224 [Parvularcula bermudensis HTCC2503]
MVELFETSQARLAGLVSVFDFVGLSQPGNVVMNDFTFGPPTLWDADENIPLGPDFESDVTVTASGRTNGGTTSVNLFDLNPGNDVFDGGLGVGAPGGFFFRGSFGAAVTEGETLTLTFSEPVSILEVTFNNGFNWPGFLPGARIDIAVDGEAASEYVLRHFNDQGDFPLVGQTFEFSYVNAAFFLGKFFFEPTDAPADTFGEEMVDLDSAFSTEDVWTPPMEGEAIDLFS